MCSDKGSGICSEAYKPIYMIVNSSGVMQVAYINYNPVRKIERTFNTGNTYR